MHTERFLGILPVPPFWKWRRQTQVRPVTKKDIWFFYLQTKCGIFSLYRAHSSEYLKTFVR